MTTKRDPRQLRIVVAISITRKTDDTTPAGSPDDVTLVPYFELARDCLGQFENNILLNFTPLAIIEFGSAVEAFDCLSQVRTIITGLTRDNPDIQTRFSCHIGEVSGHSPPLENSVVWRSMEMIETAARDEIVVSDTFYDALVKYQGLFEKLDDRTFVMRSTSGAHGIDQSGRAGDGDVGKAATGSAADTVPATSTDTSALDQEFGEILSGGIDAAAAGDVDFCYRILGAIENSMDAASPAEAVSLAGCRENLERLIGISEPVALILQNRPTFIHFAESIEIGRRVSAPYHGVHVGCRLVSQMGRQAKIEYRDNEYHLMDLGSTNGTFLDERHVETGQWVVVPNRTVISMGGGLNPPRPGPCFLACSHGEGARAAMAMAIETRHLSPAEVAGLAANWQSIHLDGAYRWILAPGDVLLGQSAQCAFKLPGENRTAVARMYLDGRCYLEPLGDAELIVAGIPFRKRVALADETDIVVNGVGIHVSTASTYFSRHPPGTGI